MTNNLKYTDRIGILDPEGLQLNPLNNQPYSDEYKQLAKIWSKFPAFKAAETVLKGIEENQLIFIVSGTGSGKSVLIPKLALHYLGYTNKKK